MLTFSRNVGFLKYWTLSNAPLFLIAAPVLYVTLGSAWRALNEETRINTGPDAAKKASKSRDTDRQLDHRADALLFRLALPQFALSCAALTTFHVQVITRLSSGYPLWYLILAQDILDDKRTAQWVVRWMVMYAIIQAALFASFLPPA